MWLKVNEDGKPDVEGMTKPYCYHIDQFSELQPLIHKVIEYGKAMGLDMIQGDHEDAPGQLELNFNVRSRRADGRPAHHLSPDLQAGRPRAGCLPVLHAEAVHGRVGQRLPPQHLAVARRREPFMPEGDDPQLPARSACGRSAASSSTCGALTAITAPTVNSYRRFWDMGFWAPVFADWGFQNRTTALRVSAPGRFEYRSVDSAVNPYLSFAGAAQGDARRARRQARSRASRRSATSTRRWRRARRSRRSRSASARRSRRSSADEVVKSALPGEMLRGLHALQARRMGALPVPPSPTGTSRRISTSCPDVRTSWRKAIACVASPGSSIATRTSDVGTEMTAMLQSMKHRGPDSTGYALFGEPTGRIRDPVQACRRERRRGTSTSEDRLQRNRARGRVAAARDRRVDRPDRRRDGVRVPGVGSLQRRPQDASPTTWRTSRAARSCRSGTSLEIIKDLGDADERRRASTSLRGFQRHPRDRPRPHGHRVGRGHLGRPSVLGVPVRRRRGRPQRSADELLPVAPPPGALRTPLPVRVRLGDHRRVPRARRWRAARRSRRRWTRASTDLDGVFTYIAVTEDALGVAKDEMAAKPLVLYESDDIVAMASEEIAIRARRSITRSTPTIRTRGQVLVWQR